MEGRVGKSYSIIIWSDSLSLLISILKARPGLEFVSSDSCSEPVLKTEEEFSRWTKGRKGTQGRGQGMSKGTVWGGQRGGYV